MENNQDDTRISPAVYGRKLGKKTRRKPLTAARRAYEEDFPSVGVRIPKAAHMACHLDADSAKLTLSEYLTKIIYDDHKYIQKIKADALEEGKKSREPEITAAFERGRLQGSVDDAERIRSQTRRANLKKITRFSTAVQTTFTGAMGSYQLRGVHKNISLQLKQSNIKPVGYACHVNIIKLCKNTLMPRLGLQ
jgi:hypothetical protein